MKTLFFKKIALPSLSLSLILLSSNGLAASDEDKAISKAGREIMENPESVLTEEDIALSRPRLSDKYLEVAQELFDISEGIRASQKSEVSSVVGYDIAAIENEAKIHRDEKTQEVIGGDWVDVLLSESLGQSELKLIMQELAHSDVPVRVVFRGIKEDEKLNDLFARFARLNQGLAKPIPGITDPTVFSETNTNVVPRMIYRNSKDGVIAYVDGLTNPQWLKDKVSMGEQGDLGIQGPVTDILERDLIEVAKERMAQVDLEERKKQSVRTYWNRAQFISLPQATKNIRRLIDPTIIVNSDITDGRGKVITPAGTRVNPLAAIPFGRKLIVFNPNIEAELKWARNLEPAKGLKEIVIITELQRNNGWNQLEDLQEIFDGPVYLLKRDLSERFQIRRTPSIVTSERLHFVVDEYDLTPKEGD